MPVYSPTMQMQLVERCHNRQRRGYVGYEYLGPRTECKPQGVLCTFSHREKPQQWKEFEDAVVVKGGIKRDLNRGNAARKPTVCPGGMGIVSHLQSRESFMKSRHRSA